MNKEWFNVSANASRRKFLGGLLAGTGALAAGLGAWPALSGRRQNKERKLGVALLGLGRYATGELGPALRLTKNCQLVGVITGTPAKAERWAAEYNLDRKNIYNYDNLAAIAGNKDIDIVYVVTPPGLHPVYAIRAAQAGKHVISEKPMATSVADCTKMIDACRAAKVQLGIGYRLHYDPYHNEMERLCRQNELGNITQLTGRFAYVMGQKEHRTSKVLGGGGPLMDLGIYIAHESCRALGGPPLFVTAQEGPKLKPDLFDEVEETLNWTMEFKGGAKLEAYTSFNGNGNNFRIAGTKGWLDFKAQAFSYRGITCDTQRGPLQYPTINQQAAQMDDFADCVRTGRPTGVPGELGRRDIQILTAIYEAARTGRRIAVAV